MSTINFKIVFHTLGMLLLFSGAFMLLPIFTSYYYEDNLTLKLTLCFIVTIFIGLILMFSTQKHNKNISQREGYLIVTFGWLFLVISGTLPLLTTGFVEGFSNVFFETMSGFTATGATILEDIEALPKSLLLWRSIMHWLGGMGIIVLTIAIMPLFGIGGMQLFNAEAPGPNADKLKPRIADTAKRLWLIYVVFTLVEALLLHIAGMGLFDAINHSMSTMASGGFSTKNESLAFWNDSPLIQYIVIVFMFLAGTNFVMSYFAFKLNFKKIWQNEEFRWYFSFVLFFTFITTLLIYFYANSENSSVALPMVFGEAESAFRHASFQVISIITTTGFVTADYTSWLPVLTMLFFGLFFLGGSAGSTSGGIKVVRHVILIKNGFQEFRRVLHPNAILPVRYKGRSVNQKIVFTIQGFFILYALSFIIGAIVLSTTGLDFESSIGGAAACLGNIGPALGKMGPIDNFHNLTDFGKYWCSFLMLLGRLELFTVLIIFSPYFWRNR